MYKSYLILSSVSFVIDHVPLPLVGLVYFVYDILHYWCMYLLQLMSRESGRLVAKRQLSRSETYEEWESILYEMDSYNGVDLWRHNPISDNYDYRLINERLQQLKLLRQSHDLLKIVGIFRSGLIRNFGGISDKDLFIKSYVGTKVLIESYIEEALTCLEFIKDYDISDNYSLLKPNQLKLDFFHDARQTFGSTLLILQGGSLFGLCHLGVIRGLYFKNLLPRIMCGSAVGAVVAALVCTLNDEDLADHLSNIGELIASEIDADLDKAVREVDTKYGNVVENIVQKGYSHDVLIFMKYVRLKIGDLTFEEAYLQTERILNILINPTDSSVPALLNYITTPNITIWSLLYCSIGSGVLKDDIKLYHKDLNNEVKPIDSNCRFLTPHEVVKSTGHQVQSPYQRLTELFNVNHFVVSLARPYLAPLIGNDLKHSNSWYPKIMIKRMILLELRHRADLFDKFGLLFRFIKRMAIDEKTPRTRSSEITIVPEFKTLVKDFGRIFDVQNSITNISYWVLVGERSVWPLFPILWTRTAIEFALDDLYNLQRKGK